jgi:LmbE family N-acetylglucosaminyl deacetylase
MVAELQRMARKAAAQLGLTDIRFGGLPDQRLDALPLLDVVRVVDDELRRAEPDVVYTHFPGDVNLDHGVVARATWTACRPYQRPAVRRLMCFETPSSTEWGWPGVRSPFDPNVFTDVTLSLEVKLAAMGCYESELRPAPHPRSLRMLRRRAEQWGSVVGVAAAEPFMLLREVT